MEISKIRAFLHTRSEEDGDKIDELCGDITAMIHPKMLKGRHFSKGITAVSKKAPLCFRMQG